MLIRLGANELGGNAEVVSSLPNTPLEDISDPEILGDRARVHSASLEYHRRVPGNHPKGMEPGKTGDDLLGEPIAEVGVVRIGTDIVEGKNQNGIPAFLLFRRFPLDRWPLCRRGDSLLRAIFHKLHGKETHQACNGGDDRLKTGLKDEPDDSQYQQENR